MISDNTFSVIAENSGSNAPSIVGSIEPAISNKKNLRYQKILKELDKLDSIYSEFSTHRKHITLIMGQMKTSRERIHQFAKEMVESVPKSASKPNEPKNGGGGLSKPFKVSPELCHFMEVPTGTCVARAEVTKYIHAYIKNKNLYSENKQYIIPDDSLSGLLDTANNDPVHIFDIPLKMNTHFNYSSSSGLTEKDASAAAGETDIQEEFGADDGDGGGYEPSVSTI